VRVLPNASHIDWIAPLNLSMGRVLSRDFRVKFPFPTSYNKKRGLSGEMPLL